MNVCQRDMYVCMDVRYIKKTEKLRCISCTEFKFVQNYVGNKVLHSNYNRDTILSTREKNGTGSLEPNDICSTDSPSPLLLNVFFPLIRYSSEEKTLRKTET